MFEKIVIIAGVARSGSSWLGQIVDSSPDVAYRFQPLFSYVFKSAVNADSSLSEYDRFLTELYNSQDEFLLQTDKRDAGLYPSFEKNNSPALLALKMNRYQYLLAKMLELFPYLKLVGIVRHPCGTINSWLRNPKEFPPNSDPRAEWRFGACKNEAREENFFGFYKWKEVAHMYLDLRDKYSDRVKVLRYEDLVERPLEEGKALFSFIGTEMGEQTRAYLDASHKKHSDSPYAVYKDPSVKDRWRDELDPYIAEEIAKDLKGTRLEQFLS